MRRIVVLAVTALALLAAGPAVAQEDDPFDPVTPAQSTPAPAVTVDSGGGLDTGTTTLYLIGAGLLVFFVAIGVWIARDARRSIPKHDHRGRSVAEPAPGQPRPRVRDPRAKERARKKARAQRAARRHNR